MVEWRDRESFAHFRQSEFGRAAVQVAWRAAPQGLLAASVRDGRSRRRPLTDHDRGAGRPEIRDDVRRGDPAGLEIAERGRVLRAEHLEADAMLAAGTPSRRRS